MAKTVWITGASSGIGREFARRYGAMGCRLILTARRLDRLEALAAELDTDCRILPADLTQEAECRRLCRELEGEKIDIFINNAGLGVCGSFLDTDPARPERCRSTVELIAKHAAHYKQVGGAQMIALGSDFDGIGGKLELSDCSKMPLLADALRKEGFTEDEVEAIYWRNAYRFFKNNL